MNIQNNKRCNVGNLLMQPRQKKQKVKDSSINALPEELIMHIFSFLDISDLAKASRVNYDWYQMANDNILWKAIAYRIGFRELNNKKCFKTLISETVTKVQKSLSSFGAIVPGHLKQKPRTIYKLQDLFAWRFTLTSKNLLNCAKRFTEKAPTNNALYRAAGSFLNLVKPHTNTNKLFAEFVISHNIIDVGIEIAQKAGIQTDFDHNKVLQFDSKYVNSLFNECMDKNLNKLEQIKELSLSRLGLASIPGLQSLTNLTTLRLDNNSLFLLPASLRELTKLEVLHLFNNKFTSLPEVIKFLYNLKELDFGITNMTEIPDWIGNLSLLEDLAFHDTSIEQIPESAGRLKNLKFLDISETKLSSLPPCLLEMDKLSTLTIDISQCPLISQIPRNKLPQLKKIEIFMNGKPMSAEDQQLFNQIVIPRENIIVEIPTD